MQSLASMTPEKLILIAVPIVVIVGCVLVALRRGGFRVSRSQWIVVFLIHTVLAFYVKAASDPQFLVGLAAICMIPVTWTATIGRLHDGNIRGWYSIAVAFVNFLPLAGPLVIAAVMLSIPGDSAANRFGRPPRFPLYFGAAAPN